MGADDSGIFIVQLLRKQGWFVHGIRQTEHACNLLAQIPYELIIIDAEVAGTREINYIRRLQNAAEWLTTRLIFITSSQSTGFATEIAERGAFLARKSRWKEDLCAFLSAYDEDPESLHCSQISKEL
jgi:DNA-binding response OmpR family regulator